MQADLFAELLTYLPMDVLVGHVPNHVVWCSFPDYDATAYIEPLELGNPFALPSTVLVKLRPILPQESVFIAQVTRGLRNPIPQGLSCSGLPGGGGNSPRGFSPEVDPESLNSKGGPGDGGCAEGTCEIEC